MLSVKYDILAVLFEARLQLVIECLIFLKVEVQVDTFFLVCYVYTLMTVIVTVTALRNCGAKKQQTAA